MLKLWYIEKSGIEVSKTILDAQMGVEEAQDKILNGTWISATIEDEAGRFIWQLCENDLNYGPEPDSEPMDDDVEHDAWVLANAGMGTDEDYGFYGYADEY